MTDRDFMIIEAIEKYKYLTTQMISVMFFNGKMPYTYKRLCTLVKQGKIKRMRVTMSAETYESVYYSQNQMNNIRHCLGVAYVCIKLMQKYEIISIDLERLCDTIRPDAVVRYIENGEEKIMCIEYESGKKSFNYMKYEQMFSTNNWRKYFDRVPTIVLAGNGSIPLQNTRLQYKKYIIDKNFKML